MGMPKSTLIGYRKTADVPPTVPSVPNTRTQQLTITTHAYGVLAVLPADVVLKEIPLFPNLDRILAFSGGTVRMPANMKYCGHPNRLFCGLLCRMGSVDKEAGTARVRRDIRQEESHHIGNIFRFSGMTDRDAG